MPLREDLLEPIAGDNPSGPDLQYDKVFAQLKEARQEDDESLPSGEWGRAPKKADRVLVIKVAGETLATRSKDLRVAGWYLESLLRKEGMAVLLPGVDLIWKLQDQFWETVHPARDEEDGNADLRIGAIETAANLLAASMKAVGLTRNGWHFVQYQDALSVGLESDATTSEKSAARADAISRGKPTGEEWQKAVDGTPKAFYAEAEGWLVQTLETLDELDRFHEEKYGDDYPSTRRLKDVLESVKAVVSGILNEKRKTDPDPVEKVEGEDEEAAEGEEVEVSEPGAPKVSRQRRTAPSGAPVDKEDAYLQVAACAELLLAENPMSAVPYLLCTALRLGETRSADLTNFSFAVAPSTETRLAMRRLANDGNWGELMALCIATLPEPCGRAWLDLQRYIWRAAQGVGNESLAATVTSTVRSLLTDFPAVRTLTLDDDTSAANPETQQWIDTEVRPQ